MNWLAILAMTPMTIVFLIPLFWLIYQNPINTLVCIVLFGSMLAFIWGINNL